MKKGWMSALVLALVLAAFAGLFAAAHPGAEPEPEAAEYMEYEHAVVEQILSDSTETDPVSEDHFRGSQTLIVRRPHLRRAHGGGRRRDRGPEYLCRRDRALLCL